MLQKNSRKIAVYLGIAVLLLDAVTKFLTYRFLPLIGGEHLWYPYGGIPVFRNFFGIEFSLVHAINHGAAWGIFSNYQDWLFIGRVVLIAGILIYALFVNKNRNYDIPFALIISGATGNVIDYFVYGHVIDMFNFVLWGYDYPVFNVADTAICLGVVWLLIASSFSPQSTSKTKKKRKK